MFTPLPQNNFCLSSRRYSNLLNQGRHVATTYDTMSVDDIRVKKQVALKVSHNILCHNIMET